MKVNDREYGYTVEPNYGKVLAEIYKIVEPALDLFKQKNFHQYLVSKKFGKWYREPNKDDYTKAKEWAEEQIQRIYHANKDN